MRVPSSRSSSTVKRGSLEISRRYAASVPASSAAACRLDTQEAYIKEKARRAKAARRLALTFRFRVVAFGRSDQIGGRRLDERRTEPLLPVVDAADHLALHVFHEVVDLMLHQLDLAAHVEDDLHAREIDAEVAGQRENRFELFEILFRVEPRIALRPRGLQQAFAFVQAQRLRVDVVFLRHRADHVERLARLLHLLNSRRTSSALIRPNSRSNSLDRSSSSLGRTRRTSTIRSP